jgi:two-component system, OmpR family, phosphate regulon sensor histidine kinase PhoR
LPTNGPRQGQAGWKPLALTFAALAAAAAAGYWWAYQQLVPALAAVLIAATIAWWRGSAATERRSEAPAAPTVLPPPPPTIALDSLENAAVLIDRHFEIQSMNAEAIDAFGAHRTGEDIRVAIRHPAVIECVTTAMRQNRQSVREIEGLGRHSTVFRLRVAPAGDERLLLSFADVSPARLAERMRADFVANASHELRTPLATLVGFIETLQGPAAEDEAARRRFLEVMANEAARMTRLIDDLLSLSRIELDKNIRPREIIELQPVLDNIASTTAVALEADKRPLQTKIAAELPPVIADRDQVLQVLHNLMTNALKYGRPGTPIMLAAERGKALQGDVVRIAIADVGDGIPAEHIPRLTERFYRVDTGRSRRLGGTGLGLAIVKHIVERHRGTLEIHSELGQGTTVAFTLPAAVSQN